MSIFKQTILLFLIFGFFNFAQAGNSGNSHDYVWGEKLGWISLGGESAGINYGVTVTDASVYGYAWSEKTGWINFDDAGSDYAVLNDGSGNLSGYAWSEKMGWISFDDASVNNRYQVTIANTLGTGIFSGYAWSEIGGYINMNDVAADYGAETDWIYPVPPTATTTAAFKIASKSVHLGGNFIYNGATTTAIRGFKYATSTVGDTCDTWTISSTYTPGFSPEVFSLTVKNLKTSQTYYYRAFATNGKGTTYGPCVPFTTESSQKGSPIILKPGTVINENVELR